MATISTERKHFVLDKFGVHKLSPCSVYLPWNLDQDDILGFRPFNEWLSKLLDNLKLQEEPAHTFHGNPFALREIDVQSADWFGHIDPQTGKSSRLGFVKMQVRVENEDQQDKKKDVLPGAVFLRGGSVGMLVRVLILIHRPVTDRKQIILQPNNVSVDSEDDKYALLTIQPRIAASSLAFAEIPAGMLDNMTFTGAAAKEIKEETTLEVPEHQLFALSENVVAQSTITPWAKDSAMPQHNGAPVKETLHNAMYPSMGACDEFLPLYLCQKRVPPEKLETLKGLATGLRHEGERITLSLVPLDELCVEGGRDAKALCAYALYQYHRKKKTPGIEKVWEDSLSELRAS